MKDILALLHDYFELLYRCDVSRFDAVFHPNATLQTVGANGYQLIKAADYCEILRQRKSPESQAALRRDEIETVDQTSDSSALAKVRVLINGATFQDYLSLLRIDGQWRIVAKVYCSPPASA